MSSSPSERIAKRRSARSKSFKTPAAGLLDLEHKGHEGITPKTVGPLPTDLQKARAEARARTSSARLKSSFAKPGSAGDLILKLSRSAEDMEPGEICKESNGQVVPPPAADSDDIFTPKTVKASNETPMFADVEDVFTTKSRPWLRTRSGSLILSPTGIAPQDASSPLPPDPTKSRKGSMVSRKGSAIKKRGDDVIAGEVAMVVVKPVVAEIVKPTQVVMKPAEEQPRGLDEEKGINKLALKRGMRRQKEWKETDIALGRKLPRRSLRNANKSTISY